MVKLKIYISSISDFNIITYKFSYKEKFYLIFLFLVYNNFKISFYFTFLFFSLAINLKLKYY